ncbi:hypothetical protein HDV05_002965, partial [Chytridiales sp. JEL 0842]
MSVLDASRKPIITFDANLLTTKAYCYVDENGTLKLVTPPFSSFKRRNESRVPPPKRAGTPCIGFYQEVDGQFTYCLGCMILHNNLEVNPVKTITNKENRNDGLCVGPSGNGCPENAFAVLGSACCSGYQEKVRANGLKVHESHQKQAERTKGIRVTEPFFQQLQSIGPNKIRNLLPPSSVQKLNKPNIVCVDTAAANRSVEGRFMYIVGAVRVDADGSKSFFWSNRSGSDENWLKARWTVKIDNVEVERGDIFKMLECFASFAAGRQIVFYTGNNACDYKRLTSPYQWSTAHSNPFPPEDEWFNLGKELVAKVIDYNAIVVSPNWKLPTIHANLYTVKDASDESISIPTPEGYIKVDTATPDTIRDA